MTLLPKSNKKTIIAKDGLFKDIKGELAILKNTEGDELLKFVEDKIVLVKSIDKVFLFKIIALGALGVITQELEDMDFIDLSQMHLMGAMLIVSGDDFNELEKNVKKDIMISEENKSIIIL